MPTVEFRIGAADAARIRFGISAAHELTRAVQVLQEPSRHPLQWGWLRRVRGTIPREALDVLTTVLVPGQYVPDFLAPPPVEPTDPDTQIAAAAAAPVTDVVRDLSKCRELASGGRAARLDGWLRQPDVAQTRVAAAWRTAWEVLLAPLWPQVEFALAADLAHRSRQLVRDGVAAMARSLHERISWKTGAVRVTTTVWSEVVDCEGTGLLLVPSVFSWPGCSVITQAPQQPTIYYPARGVSEQWLARREGQADALATLLGHGRARVLLCLDAPMSTTAVATAAGLGAPTATHHLTALRSAGLVDSERAGRTVLHSRTALGTSLTLGST